MVNNIEIEWDNDEELYCFTCPFCGKKIVINDGPFCEHVLFGYEEVNSQPIYFDSDLYDKVENVLLEKRVNFLDTFYDIWEDEKPQDTRSEDPDTWDEAKQEIVSLYLENYFSLEDLYKTIRCSELKDEYKGLIEASEDGGTTYVLIEKKPE